MSQVTFVHTSRNIVGHPNIVMPVGLIPLANLLKEHNHKTEIVHYELEKVVFPGFSIIDYLKSKGSNIVCFDLHWHHNCFSLLSLARKIKREIPDSKIILGGYTASFYAEEILMDHRQIDFIIKGDSEVPLLKLVDCLEKKMSFSSVPNLLWRDDERIIKNPQSFKISQELIDELRFWDFGVLKNNSLYEKLRASKFDFSNIKLPIPRMLYFTCGRGCPVNCSYCGGSNRSQRIINNRAVPIFMHQDAAIRELKKFAQNKSFEWYTSFDPFPKGRYYIDLFRLVREEKLDIRAYFECWGLPTKEFVDEFKKTFMEGSRLVISPDSGLDEVRRKNKGFYYSNEELLEIIRYVRSNALGLEVYFTVGLSGEGKPEVIKTLSFVHNLKKKFKGIRISATAMEYEPAAPWFLDREKYGIISNRKTFGDFLRCNGLKPDTGYRTKELSKEDIRSAELLLKAVVRCKKKVPLFFKSFKGKSTFKDDFDLSELYLLCKRCPEFKKCFGRRIRGSYKKSFYLSS